MRDSNVSSQKINRLKVFAVGDGAISALNYIAGQELRSIDCVAINTHSPLNPLAPLVTDLTIGSLGTGGNPNMGKQAAEQNAEIIRRAMGQVQTVFILVAMGGGTGSGAGPVIAQLANEAGLDVQSFVMLPFTFEGTHRQKIAQIGVETFRHYVNDPVIITGDHLLALMSRNPDERQMFSLATRMLAWNAMTHLLSSN